MYDKGIFVFGSKIISTESQRDSVSSLPLELSWTIFSYLDDIALRCASHAYKTWQRIILANRMLRSRLNTFELSLVLGSKNLVRYHRRPRKRKKQEGGKNRNYLPICALTEKWMKTTVIKSKRGADDIVIHTKRFKLF